MKIKEKAIENFKNGYSCSEAIVKAAIDEGLLPEDILPVATAFSGGMGNGCLCGAVSGSQIVISYLHGKGKDEKARGMAKEIVQQFKEKNKATCCKVLTAGFDFHSPERKSHCVNMVESSSEILENVLEAVYQEA